MRKTLTLITLFLTTALSAQEMKDNLFITLHSSSLHLFHDSEFTRMDVSSIRNSQKHGMVEETDATYRKGKINIDKIRYSIKYTEYYILEDRKKSIGIYHMGTDRLFDKYERTDFNRRNIRKYTYQYHYDYKDEVLSLERIRTIEYLSEGSAEVDTAHYLDSTLFDVEKTGDIIKQYPHDDHTIHTTYELKDGRLHKKTNHFSGFEEVFFYTYDAEGKLIKVENDLKDSEGKHIHTYTDIDYNDNGLVKEARFYDESQTMLEKKIFTYK